MRVFLKNRFMRRILSARQTRSRAPQVLRCTLDLDNRSLAVTTRRKWFLAAGAIAVATAAAAAGAAWMFQAEILLELAARQGRIDVAANRPIEWQSGGDPRNRAADERPPNIVVILADDLGFNDVTFGGGGIAGGAVPTPHIDSIARDGVSFRNGYAANATCAPSRAAIMTGRYGTRFGFEFTPTPGGMMNIVPRLTPRKPKRLRHSVMHDVESMPFEDMGLPPSEITLAELLKEAGYHTAHVGKWHLGQSGGMAAHEQGFDESLLMQSGLYLPADHADVVNSRQAFDPIDQFLWKLMHFAASFNGGDPFEPARYLTDYYTDEALRVIEANRDRPFFLYLAHWAPHTPLQAAREDYEALSHIDDHRLRIYGAMVRALDRSVGRVLETLRDHGLEENTLVFFTSDNGGAGYIGLPDVNAPFRGWKMSFFEGGIHVPYVLKWPARIAPGTIFDAPVHGFDIFATAAAAASVDLPQDRQIDGVDLVPFVEGSAEGDPHDRLFWRSGHYQAVIADGWKLQVAERPARTWLFDLGQDPTERRNLAESETGKVEQMKHMLAEWNSTQAPPMWPSQADGPRNIDKTLKEPDAPDDEHVYWPN